MYEIKILKSFEDKEVEMLIKESIKEVKKKYKKSEKTHWTLTFDDHQAYFEVVGMLSTHLCEIAITETLLDFCSMIQLEESKVQSFIDSYFLFASDFLDYAIKIAGLSLIEYLKQNNTININSYLRFNLNPLKKELKENLGNPDTVDMVFGLMESAIMEKIDAVQVVAELKETFDDSEVEEVKDIKVYFEGGKFKCITENRKHINEEYLSTNYGISLIDAPELTKVVAIVGFFAPNRVILFNSINEEDKEFLMETINILSPICGEIKVFTAEENIPR